MKSHRRGGTVPQNGDKKGNEGKGGRGQRCEVEKKRRRGGGMFKSLNGTVLRKKGQKMGK